MKIKKLIPIVTSTLFIASPALTLTSCSENNNSSENNNNNINQSSNIQELATKIYNNYINIIDSELTKTPDEYLTKANEIFNKYSDIRNNNQNNLNPFQIFSKIIFSKDLTNFNIIMNGVNSNNVKVMNTCRTAIQKLLPIAVAIHNFEDKNLQSMTKEILDSFVNDYYKKSNTIIGNWWNYEIGIPKDLLKVIYLIANKYSNSEIQNWIKPIEWFKFDAIWKFSQNQAKQQKQSGANLTDGAVVVILYSNLIGDNKKIESTINEVINNVFSNWLNTLLNPNERNGNYLDGSYIFHSDEKTHDGGLAYFGGYGIELIKGIANINEITANTAYNLSAFPKFNIFYRIVETCVMPYMYQLTLSDTLSQRSVVRKGYSNKEKGAEIINYLVDFVDIAPSEYKDRLINFIHDQCDWTGSEQYLNDNIKAFLNKYKYIDKLNVRKEYNNWIETNFFNNDISNIPIGIDLYKQNNNYIFSKNQDRYSFQTPEYMFDLALTSGRTYHYECTNYENAFGYYQSDGLTLIHNNQRNNYTSDYWTVVDPYKLPGTSSIYELDITSLTNKNQITQIHKQSENSDKSLTTKIGNGVNYNRYGIVISDLYNYNDTLRSKKAYIFIDGYVLCLGRVNKLSSPTDNKKVYTTVLNDIGEQPLVESNLNVNNRSVRKFTSNTNSYYILDNANSIQTSNQVSRTVLPFVTNSSRENEPAITKTFNEVWFNHTSSPTDANNTYAYLIAPGEQNESNSIDIIKNIQTINNDDDKVVVKYKNYYFVSTFADNVTVNIDNHNLTFTKPTTSMFIKEDSSYKAIVSSNIETATNNINMGNISILSSSKINNKSEITYKNNVVSINNRLYKYNDILHNSWFTFRWN